MFLSLKIQLLKTILTCWYIKCIWPQYPVTVESLYLILDVEIRLYWERSHICVTIPQWCKKQKKKEEEEA